MSPQMFLLRLDTCAAVVSAEDARNQKMPVDLYSKYRATATSQFVDEPVCELNKLYKKFSLSLSCSMGSMPVGVHDIFHEMGPFLPVHRQCVQIADVLVAPVR